MARPRPFNRERSTTTPYIWHVPLTPTWRPAHTSTPVVRRVRLHERHSTFRTPSSRRHSTPPPRALIRFSPVSPQGKSRRRRPSSRCTSPLITDVNVPRRQPPVIGLQHCLIEAG
ncbi:hypothetical protein DPEC_G00301410 [Dallia pectoralis]|uniref:Uncharacterized protein n=1 Tax=Dallia pectoralis TaxID=75939 RepID=A0ACC2FGT5_DALPE|nr:hypothetical protein DPEC_G00301410 [Dallia pectoralis]